jgi:CxxC-x17-CxxC domain-containing protein
MTFQDKSLVCASCGSEFAFTAGEQVFYAERGFCNVPRRCRRCRALERPDGSRGRRRSTGPVGAGVAGGDAGPGFEAHCSSCGAQTRLPFVPDGIRPVYCRSCWQSRRAPVRRQGG